MTTTEGERLRTEERTAVFLALAAVEIQKTQGSSPVYSRRLFKVLANCIWDWANLLAASSGRIRVGSIGDFVWVPYRFGSLGRIMPSIRYDGVPFTDGLFVHPVDLFRCPQYAKYGVKIVRGQNGMAAFECPPFLTFEEVAHAGALPVDVNFWREAVTFYAGLSDESLDVLASCRTDTAATLNLWTQIVLWKDDLSTVFRNLQDFTDRDRALRVAVIQKDASNASAAAHQFGIKVEYWRKRDHVISDVRALAAKIELGKYIPVTLCPECPLSTRLNSLVAFEPCLSATNLIIKGLFYRLGIHERAVDLEEIENATDIVSSFLSRSVSFHELVTLWYRIGAKDVGHYVQNLVALVTAQAEVALNLRITDRRVHFHEFIASHYPLPRISQ